MNNIKSIVRPNILALNPYSSARDDYSKAQGVFLDANENPYGTLNRYPDPYQQELKKLIGALKNIPKKNIFIGNGSDEIIDLAFRIFCEPGKDKALTFSPTYGMYDVVAGINNVALIKIPLDDTFQIDLEKTLPELENCKLMIICSPNNPTGNLINKKDIELLLKRFKGMVLIDEAYIDFATNGSVIKLIKKYSNIMVCQTFSKAWGLAGARIGIAYSNPLMIELFNKTKPPYNVSELNQKAACNAIVEQEEFKIRRQKILLEKTQVINELKKLAIVQKIYPSDSNFLLVEFKDANSTYNRLIKQKIITRNRNQLVRNCLRITIGKPEENQQLLTALKNIQ
mgnify:CR=1 FL=1